MAATLLAKGGKSMKESNFVGLIFMIGIVVLVTGASLGYTLVNPPAEPEDPEGPLSWKEIEEINPADMEDKSATGKAYGNNSEVPIEVEVTVSGGKITEIKIINHEETEGISDPAFEQIPPGIMDSQRVKIDVVSGATRSSEGIMRAVADALLN